MGHTEIAFNPAFRISALLRCNHREGDIVKIGKSAHDGRIIRKTAVAVELEKTFENPLDILRPRLAVL